MSTVWREATIEDYPGIERCHHELEEALGRTIDLEKFDAPQVLTWMVAERDGEIVLFFVFEKCIEFRMGGNDIEALQGLIEEAPGIMEKAKLAGIRWMHCCVPPEVAPAIGRHLKSVGFDRSPNVLFAADLKQP